jgi:Ca2+-binding RTX toxin-like protein
MVLIPGTSANDQLYAKGSGDELLGLEGNDTLDAVAAGKGNNTLKGGAGNDSLFANTNDKLYGDEGNDFLNAEIGKGKNQLYGGEGNDNLRAGSNDELYGGSGQDDLRAGQGGSTLDGGSSADLFWLAIAELPNKRNVIKDFTQGQDKLGLKVTGVEYKNLKITKQGSDTLIKTQDDKEIAILIGFQGTLTADDFTDKDLILPASTPESNSSKTIYAKSSNELITGTDGNDIIDAVAAGKGNNTLKGGAGQDQLFANTNDKLYGEAGNDVLNAEIGKGGNILDGGDGNDVLKGGINDQLIGGAGQDKLYAGQGNSTLQGGTGSDLFWIALGDLPKQANTVKDFTQGRDKLGINAAGLDFNSLKFAQENGSTVIMDKNGTRIAVLEGFTGTLTAGDFTNKDEILTSPVVAQADKASTSSSSPIAIDVLANDQGPGKEIESYDKTTAKGGTVSLTKDGKLLYTPPATANGIDVNKAFDLLLDSEQGNFKLMGDGSPTSYTDTFYYKAKDADGNANGVAVDVEVKNDARIKFTLSVKEYDAAYVNEIGVFKVAADGTLNGLKPGDPGYVEAALRAGKTIFSSPSSIGQKINFDPTRVLDGFNASDNLSFYLVQNNSVDNAFKAIAEGKNPEVFFASVSGNGGKNLNHLQISTIPAEGGFKLSWEDITGLGDKDYNDLIMKVQLSNDPVKQTAKLQSGYQGELLDITGQSAPVKAKFELSSYAGFNNTVGFYPVLDKEGTIADINGKLLKPSDPGYAKAALEKRIDLNLTKDKSNLDTTLSEGQILAPYLIANGTVDDVLKSNADNQFKSDGIPVAYFNYLGANPDKSDHIRSSGDNLFVFEDLFATTDLTPDFEDMILKVTI